MNMFVKIFTFVIKYILSRIKKTLLTICNIQKNVLNVKMTPFLVLQVKLRLIKKNKKMYKQMRYQF